MSQQRKPRLKSYVSRGIDDFYATVLPDPSRVPSAGDFAVRTYGRIDVVDGGMKVW
jgi:hypothetical protein